MQGTLAECQIPRRELEAVRALGAGQFGEVYLSEQVVKQGEGDDGTNRIKRAVKILRNGASVNDRVRMQRAEEHVCVHVCV